MLIVAIPKSASTSLLATLKELHEKDGEQIFFPERPVPKEINILHQFHSDIRMITDEQVKIFSDPNRFYKQHIFPSERNKRKLESLRKVILLREPEEIIYSYYRSKQKYLSDGYPGMSACRSPEEWLEHSKEIGLFQDLRFFYHGWEEEDQDLIIHYSDLVANPKELINRIERFWGLEITTEDFTLSKKRYTRIPHGIAYLQSIADGIKSIVTRRNQISRLDKLVLYSMNSLSIFLFPDIWDENQKQTPNIGKLYDVMKEFLSDKIRKHH